MKILVFGAGGVGSVVGAFLARMGHEVSLLGRPWHLDVIEKKGLAVTGLWGDYYVKAFTLYRTPEEIQKKHERFDLIILTVKSYDTAKAVEGLVCFLDESTMVLSLQNGLGNMETILTKIKPEQVLMGRVIFGVDMAPGAVKVTVSADPVAIGAIPGVTPKLGAASVAQIFNLSKIQARAVPNILSVIWAKVIYNCALNGICSVREIPYGKILERDDTRDAMRDIVFECYRVGKKKGITLEPEAVEDYVELLTHTLIPRTATHFPSMLRDIRRGRGTEIDSLNGAICRLGTELDIPTPANEEVVRAVMHKVNKN